MIKLINCFLFAILVTSIGCGSITIYNPNFKPEPEPKVEKKFTSTVFFSLIPINRVNIPKETCGTNGNVAQIQFERNWYNILTGFFPGISTLPWLGSVLWNSKTTKIWCAVE